MTLIVEEKKHHNFIQRPKVSTKQFGADANIYMAKKQVLIACNVIIELFIK